MKYPFYTWVIVDADGEACVFLTKRKRWECIDAFNEWHLSLKWPAAYKIGWRCVRLAACPANDKSWSIKMIKKEKVSGNLPLGLTKTPEGWPLMAQAFIDFALWAVRQEDFLDQFKTDTGHDIRRVVPQNAIDRMIDKACGFDGKETFAAFLDWLVVNHWGEAGQEDEEDEEDDA